MNKIYYNRLFFSEKLERLMADQGITQKQLAKETGISQSTISRYLNLKIDFDINRITRVNLIAIATHFEIAVQSLIKKEIPKVSAYEKVDKKAKYAVSSEGLIKMARKILTSDTEYGNVLTANIQAFHRAIKAEGKLMDHEKRLAALEKKLTYHTGQEHMESARRPASEKET